MDSYCYPIDVTEATGSHVRSPVEQPCCVIPINHRQFPLCCQVNASPEVLEAYMGLERAIWREEQQVPAPAPALSFATARLEALNLELHASEQRIANWSRAGDAGSDESVRRVVLELGIHRNETRAAEHEEFISTINRQVRSSLTSHASCKHELRYGRDNVNGTNNAISTSLVMRRRMCSNEHEIQFARDLEGSEYSCGNTEEIKSRWKLENACYQRCRIFCPPVCYQIV